MKKYDSFYQGAGGIRGKAERPKKLTDENRMLLVGHGKRKQRTPGSILKTNYAKDQIRPRHFNLLDKMFSVDQMNIRNR
ncbi:MAG: hypothetical protein LIO92_00755 [Clostridiales bacterium]|nr:hypothetical protein [Clostridiales bacterium]